MLMVILKVIGWIALIVIALLIFIFIYASIVTDITRFLEFKKNFRSKYNAKQYKFNERWKMKRIHKKTLKNFNKDYTKHYDYIVLNYKDIFKDYPRSIKFSLLSEYSSTIARYENSDIHKKAVEKITKCLNAEYTILSIIEYFEKHISNAQETLQDINKENYKYYYPEFYQKRRNELLQVVHHAQKITKYLEEERLIEYKEAIIQLEMIKKTKFLEKAGMFAFNVLTAPVRHIINIIDGIEEGDKGKVQKGVAFLLF